MRNFLSTKRKDKIIAIGECGLDYERLFCAEEDTQKMVFEKHFDLAQEFNLPMVLHSRGSTDDFYDMVKANRSKFSQGVVHCFTGETKEM